MRKCPYCDFNSHQADIIPEEEYVLALLADLKSEQEFSFGRKIHSIFIGGGTPSLFHPKSIARILDKAEKLVGFSDNIEITMEANPGASEYSSIEGYKTAGVNRLSFGVQSFNDTHLKSLGRIHNSGDAIHAFGKARKAGFDNINIDLMHGLPQQTLKQAITDLKQGIELGVEHLSWYQLTIEPNTVFYNRPPTLPDDEILCDIQEAGHPLLIGHGFQHYEVSAYGKPTQRSQHNLNYWSFGDYLAIGAGAHGKITLPNGSIERYRKTRNPEDYLNKEKDFTASRGFIPKDNQMLEFMMNALRLVEGIPIEYFVQRTQLSEDDLKQPVKTLVKKGLLANKSNQLLPTQLGLRFLNDTLSIFNDTQ